MKDIKVRNLKIKDEKIFSKRLDTMMMRRKNGGCDAAAIKRAMKLAIPRVALLSLSLSVA